jgi:hypothetical protein
MRRIVMAFSWAAALGAAVSVASPGQAKSDSDCRREYAAQKAVHKTHRQKEKEFVRACLTSSQRASAALGPAAAQSTSQASASGDEASKESENPVTRWTTLPLRYEPEFFDGYYKLTKETFEIDQAIVPFKLNDDWALITRTKLPFVVQPPKSKGAEWENGLDNGYTTFFLSPEHGEGFYWGAGPVLYYPSSNSAVGVDKWGSGPSFAFVLRNDGPWVFGAVANNIWSFGGGPPSDRTNQFLLNPFISYHLGDGWAIGSSPNITANWIASGGKWTVPVGGGLSKTIAVSGQPLKIALDAYYNAVRPKADEETWLLQFTVTLLFAE